MCCEWGAQRLSILIRRNSRAVGVSQLIFAPLFHLGYSVDDILFGAYLS